jgi:uncharacterized protein
MSSEVCKFVWYELTTTDVDAAQEFYRQVIGWNVSDAGMPSYRYGIISAGSNSVGGIMAINDEMKIRGVPPCWTAYVGVANVDTKATQFQAAGGAIHVPALDVPGVGRFSVVSDPFGATLILFKPHTSELPTPVPPGTLGHFGWHELMVSDREAASNFYEKMFGWTKTSTHDMGPMGLFQMFSTGEPNDTGGMMTKFPEMPISCWAYYINVESTSAALNRVVANGGKIINGPMQVPTGEWVAQCQDPQGAFFSLLSQS